LPPVVADMVRVQLPTGVRPGELCAMRVENLDRDGPVWLDKPSKHKTEHYGHERTIAIGPQAQLVLRKYLRDDLTAFVFSPAVQDRLIKAMLRANRKTKVQPSQVDRSRPDAVRKPGKRFDVHAYNRAITRACKSAGVEHWHAHRLRHTAALLIERVHGAEAARAVLGHRTVNMTGHYSGIDVERAAKVAASMG
jgi:integrase